MTLINSVLYNRYPQKISFLFVRRLRSVNENDHELAANSRSSGKLSHLNHENGFEYN